MVPLVPLVVPNEYVPLLTVVDCALNLTPLVAHLFELIEPDSKFSSKYVVAAILDHFRKIHILHIHMIIHDKIHIYNITYTLFSVLECYDSWYCIA